MTAKKRDIVLEKGATFRFFMRFRDSTGALQNMTGFQGRLQVRATATSTTVALDATDQSLWTFDAQGRVRLRVPPTLVDAVTIAAGVYDLELVSPGGEVDRLYEGKVKIKPNVTRPT